MSQHPLKSVSELQAWFGQQLKEIQKKYPEQYQQGKLSRIEGMLRILSGRDAPRYYSNLQRPYSFFLPDLPTQPFYDTSRFPWTKILEENYEVICRELLNVLSQPSDSTFREYVGDGLENDKGYMTTREGDWTVFYFYQNFVPYEENHKLCPRTTAILKQIGEKNRLLFGMVCFSQLQPGGRILPHTGPSNMRLTCHLGLIGCKGNFVTVGDQTRPYEDGKTIIFDDSYVHSVIHTGDQRRVTLMLDFWHPDLTDLEIEAFQGIMKDALAEIDPNQFFHSLGILNPKQPLDV